MTTSQDHGWHDDRPCPPWCITGTEHLEFRLQHRMDDLWHKGAATKVLTQGVTYNLEPIEAEVYLQQHEQVDERGHFRHPIDISVDFGELFTPDEARELAAILLRLADEAEQAGD
jgi:GTP cyclohydrolase III